MLQFPNGNHNQNTSWVFIQKGGLNCLTQINMALQVFLEKSDTDIIYRYLLHVCSIRSCLQILFYFKTRTWGVNL